MSGIPYAIERRPDTGVNNVMLGMWLFLASEVMLFGGLFSAYALLRAGADHWPSGTLEVGKGAVITVVMLGASFAMFSARKRAAAGGFSRARVLLHLTSVLAILFLGLKTWEWAGEMGQGVYPRSSTFAALYYLLTGVHALHVLGGLAANLFVTGRRVRLKPDPVFTNRLAATALYWYFIDVVWIVIFVLLYVV